MTVTAVNRQRAVKPPTEAQIHFATALGLVIPEGANLWDVSRLIKQEVRKRGRLVLREKRFCQYSLVRHPKYGICEIERIGKPSLKVTLAPTNGARKIVIDAMYLEKCTKVEV